MSRGLRFDGRVLVLIGTCWLLSAGRLHAQLGALVSPGPLSRAHAALEGLSNCQKCHEPGRRVTPARCLACHQPVAERIMKKKGVHRASGADCVPCHAEHGGIDAELRPFDQKAFDHAAEAGLALDGKHAGLACAACHKARSFLTLSTSCASCHTDVHKGSLGANCSSCHPTTVAFTAASQSFDHAKAAFSLTGAHRSVECARCHVNGAFKGIKFDTCAACHKDPHRPAFAGTCSTCHDTVAWKTQKIDHSRTAFPLLGKHASVACASCHRDPAMRVKPVSATCAACHADPHRGGFKQDCGACHTVQAFAGASFDHAGATRFPLTGKHEAIACRLCHKDVSSPAVPLSAKVADYRGLAQACASCHDDVHKGQLGATCEQCHSTTAFRVETFNHPRFPEFFAGQHADLTCSACHKPAALTGPVRTGASVAPVTFRGLPTTCATCHTDPHLGQVGADCAACHNVSDKFATIHFTHDRTALPLTGRHAAVECAVCHKRETADFPSGRGAAVRLKGVSTACSVCHTDPHLGQLGATCEGCHGTDSFKLPRYAHQNRSLAGFFVGRHASAACQACHKSETGRFPAGEGTAIRYKVDTACATCHTDPHHGSLGTDCGSCHRPLEEHLEVLLRQSLPARGAI